MTVMVSYPVRIHQNSKTLHFFSYLLTLVLKCYSRRHSVLSRSLLRLIYQKNESFSLHNVFLLIKSHLA